MDYMPHMLHGVEVKIGTICNHRKYGKVQCVRLEPPEYTGRGPYLFKNEEGYEIWLERDSAELTHIADNKNKLMPTSPATLEAETLAKRLERLRVLIVIERDIAAHKSAGKALSEKHAALVAELYPVAPKAKGKAKR